MNTRRLIVVGGLALVTLAVAASVHLSLVGTLFAFASRAFFPQDVSWDAKDGWSKCEGAVAGSIAWPSDPTQACAAMRMC